MIALIVWRRTPTGDILRTGEKVAEAMIHWRDRFTRFGVGTHDLRHLAPSIEHRLKTCREIVST